MEDLIMERKPEIKFESCKWEEIYKFVSDYMRKNNIVVDSFWEDHVIESNHYKMTCCNFDLSHWDSTKDLNGTAFVMLTLTTPKSSKEVEEFLNEWQTIYTRCMESECKYALLFDTRKVGSFDLSYLGQMTKWLGKMKGLTEQWMDRTAIIVSNPLIKTFIGMVFAVYKPVRPFKVFTKKETQRAMEWALSTDPGDRPETLKVK